ncbi:MAG: hypothetical protein WCO66_03010 [Candidatus Absconditabacteria bacterium]
MKKILPALVFVLIVCGLFPSKGFSYYENKLYCRVAKDSVLISLNAKDGQLCNRYIRSLELSMKNTYMDMVAIQKYIDKRQDVGYWKPLKDEKTAYLSSLQSVRLNILAHMKSFELSLLQKSKDYFMASIADYKKNLFAALTKLSTSTDPRSISYMLQIKQQIDYIKAMDNSASFEIFAVNLQKYLYLKQLLVGK